MLHASRKERNTSWAVFLRPILEAGEAKGEASNEAPSSA